MWRCSAADVNVSRQHNQIDDQTLYVVRWPSDLQIYILLDNEMLNEITNHESLEHKFGGVYLKLRPDY